MRLALLTIVAAAAAAAPLVSQTAPATPIVVELFTSEGCSDCPPADAVLEQLIAEPPVAGVRIIGLGQHVDYWDAQGWKDRFSSAALTNRQQIYGARFNLDSVYTPQMVVDGRHQFVGSDRRSAAQAIARAAAAPHAVLRLDVDAHDSSTVAVTVNVRDASTLARGEKADVVVAVSEDHLRSDVTRGENRGRTLTHAAVVRSMTTIGQVTAGDWTVRGSVPVTADWKRDELTIVAFAQERRGRAILGAAAVALRAARP
jgi:hypothetical protein